MASARKTRIDEIRSLLQSGVSSLNVDGVVTSFDHETLRRELRALEESEGIRRPRAKVANIFLG